MNFPVLRFQIPKVSWVFSPLETSLSQKGKAEYRKKQKQNTTKNQKK
jgi:hypothetical protein